MLLRAWKPILTKSGKDLARNAARGYMLATPICLLTSSLRLTFFDLILAFNTNVSNFFIILVLQVGVNLIFEVINLVTMQPIDLPLISQASGTIRQGRLQQNLINAITSDNDLLRVNTELIDFDLYSTLGIWLLLLE